MRTVVGLTIRVPVEQFEDLVWRTRIEENASSAFLSKHGYEPNGERLWRYEAAGVWTDETGEEFEMPEQWVLQVEGWKE